MAGFEWYDTAIFIATLSVSLLIGAYFAWLGQSTNSEYLAGARRLSLIPTSLSMLMSTVSAILVLASAAETYQYGWVFTLWTISNFACSVFVAYSMIPVIYPMKVTTAFEYLKRRFESPVITNVSVYCTLVGNLFYMGVATFAPCTALQAVLGVPIWVSITITTVLCTIYTSLGGIKAVIWTDVFQFLVLLVGVMVVFSLCLARMTIAEIWHYNAIWQRLEWPNFSLDPTVRVTFWSVMISRFVSGFLFFGINQATLQRWASLKTLQHAKMSVLIFSTLCSLLGVVLCLNGLFIFAHYTKKGCDPLQSGEISNQNQLLPYFISHDLMVPILPGLFMSVLFSGALSSISSTQNALAAITWKDLIEPRYPDLLEIKKVYCSKALSLFYGMLTIPVAIMVGKISGHVIEVISILSDSATTPILGLFLLAIYVPRVGTRAALIGALAGTMVTLLPSIASLLSPPPSFVLNATVASCVNVTNLFTSEIETPRFYHVSFMWRQPFGTLTTVTVAFLMSYVFKSERAPDELVCSWVRCKRTLTRSQELQALNQLFSDEDGSSARCQLAGK